MEPSAIFPFTNYIAMLGWLFLIFLPGWKWTQFVTTTVIMLLLGILYIYLLGTSFGQTEGGFGSLEEVALLFANKKVLLAGWVHYLAFDLFLGTWIVKDSRKHGIYHLIVIPALFFTFMSGPFGVLLYFLIRFAKTRKMVVPNLD